MPHCGRNGTYIDDKFPSLPMPVIAVQRTFHIGALHKPAPTSILRQRICSLSQSAGAAAVGVLLYPYRNRKNIFKERTIIMKNIFTYTISALGLAILAVVAMPLALALGIMLLIAACLGAGAGLAGLAVLLIIGAVFCCIALHVLLPLAIPVLIVLGIIYLVRAFTRKTA
jgi:hypothetical protein